MEAAAGEKTGEDMGRAVPKPRTNKLFSLRLSPSERAALDRAAGEAGVPSGRYVRRLIREAVGTDADLFPDELKEFRNLRQSVKAVGRNLNQITRRLNTAAARDEVAELHAGNIAVVAAVEEAVNDVVRKLADIDRLSRSRRIRLRRAASRAGQPGSGAATSGGPS